MYRCLDPGFIGLEFSCGSHTPPPEQTTSFHLIFSWRPPGQLFLISGIKSNAKQFGCMLVSHSVPVAGYWIRSVWSSIHYRHRPRLVIVLLLYHMSLVTPGPGEGTSNKRDPGFLMWIVSWRCGRDDFSNWYRAQDKRDHMLSENPTELSTPRIDDG